jgi:molybdate transport system substrate-binding protein
MKKKIVGMTITCMVSFLFFWITPSEGSDIEVFSGTGMVKPLNEIAELFSERYGHQVNITYKSGGQSMITMELTKSGCVFFPGSEIFLHRGVEKGIIRKEHIRKVADRIPVIMVRKGNPKNIQSLSDIYKGDASIVSFCLHDEQTTLGKLAREKLLSSYQMRLLEDNILSVEATLALVGNKIVLTVVDAGFGWLSYVQSREDLEAIRVPELDRHMIKLSIAPTIYAKDYDASLDFVEFVGGKKGRRIFKNHGFMVKE